MSKKKLIFAGIEIEKNKFYRHVDIEKVLVSTKIFFGEKNCKYYIDYLYNDHKVKPSHIMLLQVSTNVKSYDGQTKWMYFLIEEDDLLEKYNTIWDKDEK